MTSVTKMTANDEDDDAAARKRLSIRGDQWKRHWPFRERIHGAAVDTLGFAHPLFPPRSAERHVEVDLNDADSPRAPEPDGQYDAIVMAEVIEHLHTAPSVVLRYLAGWLTPGGALVIQTPNAVALHKRIRMLLGRNPMEPPRESRGNPGHFHEYTVGELRAAATAAGLEVSAVRTANYFGASSAAKAYGALGRVLPPRLRHGITLCLRRPVDGSTQSRRGGSD